jgi:ribosome-associated protein
MFDPRILIPELTFKAVRSGGKGGQHVNKVSTAVELYFNVFQSRQLSDEQKRLISEKLKNRINAGGELIVVSQTERSQLANKKRVTARFEELVRQALKKKPRRIPTKISASQKQKRLDTKKKHSEKKHRRSGRIHE